mmetsp:Transcript_14634/g.25717  ORF Transcript_14634/g.25717 Transcript_14634/m.25717 type:complete len:627 (-) Transcript_14634:85-1965(-)
MFLTNLLGIVFIATVRAGPIKHIKYLPRTLTIPGAQTASTGNFFLQNYGTNLQGFLEVSGKSYLLLQQLAKKNKTQDDTAEIYERLRCSKPVFYDMNGILKRACNVIFTRSPTYQQSMQELIRSMGISFLDPNGTAALVFSMHLAQIITYSSTKPENKARAYFEEQLQCIVSPGQVFITPPTFERWAKIIFPNGTAIKESAHAGRRLPGSLPWFASKVRWDDVDYALYDDEPTTFEANLFSAEVDVVLYGQDAVAQFEMELAAAEARCEDLLGQLRQAQAEQEELKDQMNKLYRREKKVIAEAESPEKEAALEEIEADLKALRGVRQAANRAIRSLSKRYFQADKSLKDVKAREASIMEDAAEGDRAAEQFEGMVAEEVDIEAEEAGLIVNEGQIDARLVASELEVGLIEEGELLAMLGELAAVALMVIGIVLLLMHDLTIALSLSGFVVNSSPEEITSCSSRSTGNIGVKFLRDLHTPIDPAEKVGFMNSVINDTTWDYQGFFATMNVAPYTAMGDTNPFDGTIAVSAKCNTSNSTLSGKLTNHYELGPRYKVNCKSLSNMKCFHGAPGASAMLGLTYSNTIPLPPAPRNPTSPPPPLWPTNTTGCVPRCLSLMSYCSHGICVNG